ncbi:hypothetical protein BJI67_13460 [Acidihalobacter aeolianus]|uniref:Cytochrome c domain-containing protein n=1 Tax=Acidihalobacter aeolianus TaxID=2792603 RepID=A0A1D8KAD7_9GAMM|nr:hypothetical protein BJI67_13460 [Acidihalobacter aeolianus]
MSICQAVSWVPGSARCFVNCCLSCHTLSAVRYNHLEQLGLTPAQIRENLIFSRYKIDDKVHVTIL